MKPHPLSRRPQCRPLVMLLLGLLAFLLTALSAFAAECLEIVPYRRLGALQIGAPSPAAVLGNPVKPDPAFHTPSDWLVAGSYRFRAGKEGRLDYLQRTVQGKAACLSVAGKRLSSRIPLAKLREKLPGCAFYPGIPVDQLQCEGFLLLLSTGRDRRILRADVSNDSPARHDAERAAQAVDHELRLWWPKGAAYPFPR